MSVIELMVVATRIVEELVRVWTSPMVRPPLVLAEPISAFGHVIYELNCPSRVSAYNFTARAVSHPITLHSALCGFIPDRFAIILVSRSGCALVCVMTLCCTVLGFLLADRSNRP